jgi:general secretion pathway protein G
MVLRTTRRPDRAAFTLMEMLVVVAIIVMLAGIGGWVYMRQLETAREQKARIDIQHLASLIDQYKVEQGDYPESLQALAQPSEGKPAFIEAKELVDPWGQPYVYEPQNKNPSTFRPRISCTHQSAEPIANW